MKLIAAFLLFLIALELPWLLIWWLMPWLWFGTVIGALIALYFEIASRSPAIKRKPRRCHQCRYDFAGNVTEACPGCGTPVLTRRALLPKPLTKTFFSMSQAGVWLRRRLIYRNLLVAFFTIVAFYFAPHVILFHKLTPLAPDDFVDDVNSRLAPVVSALYQYQHDTGQWPSQDLNELYPKYLPKPYMCSLDSEKRELTFYDNFARITCRLKPGHESWYASGMCLALFMRRLLRIRNLFQRCRLQHPDSFEVCMYCNKCHARLDPKEKVCLECGVPFDPSKLSTYSQKAFPKSSAIVFHVVSTTLVAIMAGLVVAFFQLASMGGH